MGIIAGEIDLAKRVMDVHYAENNAKATLVQPALGMKTRMNKLG